MMRFLHFKISRTGCREQAFRTRRLALIVGLLILTGFSLWAGATTWQARAVAAIDAEQRLADRRVPGGVLVVVGGGHLPLAIRDQFVQLAGGRKARIVVIPASDPQTNDIENWIAPWRTCGVTSVDVCHAAVRNDVESPAFRALLEQATGVWFGGGNQRFLADRYADSPLEGMLGRVLAKNGVVGGSSAGAAILSRVMIAAGDHEPVEGRGLGLFPNCIVDQHFLRRNRFWRLQQMLGKYDGMIGFGIDEQTALIVNVSSNRLRVVGESYVFACLPAAAGQLPRFEVLKEGDTVYLDDLRAGHLPSHPEVDWDSLCEAVSD